MENNQSVFSNFTEYELRLLKQCKAKTNPDESIYSHSYKCYNLSAKILEKFFISKSVIECEKIKIEPYIIKDICAFHVLLHDLGKSDIRFQNKMDGKIKFSPPHALLSLEKAKEKLTERIKKYDIAEEQKKLLKSISLLSIASHHSDYHRDLYKKNDSEPSYKILKESVDYLDEIKFPNYHLPSEIKFLYTFFNGVLRMSDWISSGNLETKNLFFENQTELSERTKSYLKFKNFALYEHQKYFKTNFNCGFMRLPTGDGKTETSLLANF
ncbi:MAG: CRISPR-associated endonuclease Cas3'', partial [Candidatus Altiarchaeales archaeon A3]